MSEIKYKIVGSNMLGLKNPHDLDIVIFDNSDKKYLINYFKQIYPDKKIDIICIPTKNTINHFFSNNIRQLIFYQYCSYFKEDNPFDFNYFNYKNEMIKLLKSKQVKLLDKEGKLRKFCYHILYNIFIINNNSFELTEKQKSIIQNVHDCIMDSSYALEIEKMIDNL